MTELRRLFAENAARVAARVSEPDVADVVRRAHAGRNRRAALTVAAAAVAVVAVVSTTITITRVASAPAPAGRRAPAATPPSTTPCLQPAPDPVPRKPAPTISADLVEFDPIISAPVPPTAVPWVIEHMLHTSEQAQSKVYASFRVGGEAVVVLAVWTEHAQIATALRMDSGGRVIEQGVPMPYHLPGGTAAFEVVLPAAQMVFALAPAGFEVRLARRLTQDGRPTSQAVEPVARPVARVAQWHSYDRYTVRFRPGQEWSPYYGYEMAPTGGGMPVLARMAEPSSKLPLPPIDDLLGWPVSGAGDVSIDPQPWLVRNGVTDPQNYHLGMMWSARRPAGDTIVVAQVVHTELTETYVIAGAGRSGYAKVAAAWRLTDPAHTTHLCALVPGTAGRPPRLVVLGNHPYIPQPGQLSGGCIERPCVGISPDRVLTRVQYAADGVHYVDKPTRDASAHFDRPVSAGDRLRLLDREGRIIWTGPVS